MRLDQQKKDLRSSFRQRAELFAAPKSPFLIERFNENLFQFLQQQSGLWAAYKAIGNEPCLEKALRTQTHLRWAFPKMENDTLVFYETESFTRGAYGVEEPKNGKLVALEDIHGFLVPGVAFDRQGGRLGRGKGFYDRALAKAPGRKVGLGFGFQIYEGTLPCETFDVAMDDVVTEQGLMLEKGKKWKS